MLLARHAGSLAGRDCIFFLDNESAVSALVRVTSDQPDAELIAQIVHCITIRVGVRVWWDWVDTHSNPADPLSRAGLLAPQVIKKEWAAEHLHLPEWRAGDDPWEVADRILRYFAGEAILGTGHCQSEPGVSGWHWMLLSFMGWHWAWSKKNAVLCASAVQSEASFEHWAAKAKGTSPFALVAQCGSTGQ